MSLSSALAPLELEYLDLVLGKQGKKRTYIKALTLVKGAARCFKAQDIIKDKGAVWLKHGADPAQRASRCGNDVPSAPPASPAELARRQQPHEREEADETGSKVY